MSLENLKEYARRCATEEDLRSKAKEIGVSNLDAHMSLAGSLGLDWSAEDMKNLQREVFSSHDNVDDLSEEELEMVAGGLVTTTAAVVVGAGAAAGVVVGAGVGAGVAATGSNSAW